MKQILNDEIRPADAEQVFRRKLLANAFVAEMTRKKEKNPRWYFLSLHIKNSINSLRADRRNFQVCLKVTVLFLLFHIETRVSLLPLTKFSTACTDPFNNSPIDFKLTRTRYRTENFPCCERKGVTTTLAF